MTARYKRTIAMVGMILHVYIEYYCRFGNFREGFYAKFRENKTLAKC